ncbi:UDP-glucose 4-epimerase GalE [Achromobacter sp. NFACC18-2]|uniref:UDP-glucose 4-epimerase GalE n=1 Tax=Achromobacter sp. NFACC18-2 TaxID=1564112 RepID=UPI0008C35155|nr:UDP-glucose 4-epimerase GalE [Achromobacter sp. NFACC18-2]SEJ41605.1 UDP-galactose 4-epimerase [Achromobacter sp. NFACC18-2]
MSSIFVTGGAGYIGTHTCLELLQAGHKVFVYDNLSNSSRLGLERVERITNTSIEFIEGDVTDANALTRALQHSQCESVIHFAGLKAVGESVTNPLAYYHNNVVGTLTLLRAMLAVGLKKLVFSSSATVYGEPQLLPIDEAHPLSATNPYGRTKLVAEDMLRDHFRAYPDWNITILRYFNPVGAHESGLIGEDPKDTPNNLMPYIAQVAIGLRDRLNIWGNDYPTADGTGVRDYIHVVDLAIGHVKAIATPTPSQCIELNLGTGRGYSVLEVLRAFELASGKAIPHEFFPRRPGDVAACYASTKQAESILQWRAERNLEDMCVDHWRWQHLNPAGYGSNNDFASKHAT